MADTGVTTPRPPAAPATSRRRVLALRGGVPVEEDDELAGEEPLQIRAAGPGQRPRDVAVTLRTPGSETELAVGFLHGEGLVRPGEVAEVTLGEVLHLARPDDTVTVHLTRDLDLGALAARRTAATAACGVCGKASIDDLHVRCDPLPPGPVVPASTLLGLPDRLRAAQEVFAATGGLHGAATADADGDLLIVREDIGRHNALDAVVGAHLLAGDLPLHGRVLVLSGRIGFELVQKAALAGLSIVVAVGAASDLAVRTAEALGLTLVGFVRGDDANVYTRPERVDPER
jgi:FdhD protein